MRLKMNYMNGDKVSTVIIADYKTKEVLIENKTSDNLDRAFGIIEHPSFKDYEDFLESRCFPRTRDKMPLMLKMVGVPYYEPLLIIKKSKGCLAGDPYWLDIIEEVDD